MSIVTKGWVVNGYRPDSKKAERLSKYFAVREAAAQFAELARAARPELRVEVETKMCWDESGAQHGS